MRLAALIAAALTACVLAATARADGDPASDYLLSYQVFLPFDAKIPKEKQQELTATLADANRRGYKIRAAIIASSYDMGAITSLWRKPKTYARFLGLELRFVYKQRLLIVMPNGFGFFDNGRPVAREYATLAKIPIGSGAVGLVDAAQKAVVALAAGSGVQVAARGGSSAPSHARQRVIIVIAAVVGVLVLALLRVALRRKRA
jgi:hypothetical protein